MKIIEDKEKVSIAYILKEISGRILEEVPASHPFIYIHGFNSIIPGLESALSGRKIGEKFTIKVPSQMGYGDYRNDLVMHVPKEELQDIGELWLGMELELIQENDIREFQLPETAEEFCEKIDLNNNDENDGIFIVKEILKDSVLVDGNHPFAGKDLIFEVEVVSIDEASFTELESGIPDEDNINEDNQDSYFDNDYNQNDNRRWR